MQNDSNIYTSSGSPTGPTMAINAKEILLKYLHHIRLFILLLLLSLCVAWLYIRYKKPEYSVSSTLLIRNDVSNRSSGSTNGQDMFSDIALFQSNTNKQNEILILSSRTMMERVVKILGLQTQYAVVGNVKTTNVYPEQPFELKIIQLNDSTNSLTLEVRFSKDWSALTLGENKRQWPVGEEIEIPGGRIKFLVKRSAYTDLDYRDFIVKWMPLRQAAIFYGSGLEVKPANDLSNVLGLTYVNENSVLASTILNTLMQEYNQAAIEDKNEINRKILSFINDRLGLVEGQLDSVEGNLERYRTSRNVIDLTTQSTMYFGNISELNEALRVQEVQLEVVQLLEEYINQPKNKLSLVPSTLGLTDPTLLEFASAYNKLVNERLAELQTGATTNSPIIRNIETNIEEARLKMLQSLVNIKQVYQSNIKNLNNRAKALKNEISSIPLRERMSREKARQQEIKQNLYLYLLQKREESEIAQASTIASSRIIDTALPLSNKVNPIPLRIYGIALLAGLLIPIAIIYIRDLLNDKVTTKDDIIKDTNTPIVGEIGHSEEEKVLLFPGSSRSVVAEQVRILRSNLRFVLSDKSENPVVLVTSSFSGEGKSFISTNLGATLSLSGKRTVILEFDLRKPKILTGLGLPKSHGLTNYLVGSTSLEELPQSVPEVENLHVISCGPVPPNPSELLLVPKINELFVWLKSHYDAIVIDTAPVGLVSDAFTLSQYADATIYVIRHQYTYKRQLHFINELYNQKRLPQMGILINDVKVTGSRGYYGYGARRYGYGYGYAISGVDKKIKKRSFWRNIIKGKI